MALRMKVKLSTLKVTQRSYRNIPRGRSTASTSLVQDTSGPGAEESECQYETSDDLFSSEPMLSETVAFTAVVCIGTTLNTPIESYFRTHDA